MRHLVRVTLRRLTDTASALPSPAPLPHPPAPSLVLRVTSAGSAYDLTARVGPAADLGAPVTDEHVVADADACRERPWLTCSDVLYAGCARSPAAAVSWLEGVTAAHPGCRLAAVPLVGGGWAVLDGPGRRALFLGRRVPADRPLLASCLHAWLVAGREVRDLDDIRVLSAG
ncbi:hypothetical protein K4B79_30885 [Streptomyces lincolnensis]|uniref:hypothetical protein n=1 Tax=Streptomyces lincolnensis TaxID=1915 RepID=UPI001E48C926|nr:hypothetical protein [Streptomyces lincolnensis]MCD7442612.1 hypothetical protein [Streptomyces lincolnensis]